MKKSIISFLMAVLVLLVVALPVMAATYLVKKGDTLSQISQRELGTWRKWQEIAKLNRIKNPARDLRAGQWIKLPQVTVSKKTTSVNIHPLKTKRVPAVQILRTTSKKRVVSKNRVAKSFPWHPGSNPWKGSLEAGLMGVSFSTNVALELVDQIAKGDFQWATINHNGIVTADDSSQYRMVKMAFGKSSFKDSPQPAWGDVTHLEAGKVYAYKGNFVLFPLICKNPTRLRLVKQPPKTVIPPKGSGGNNITIVDTSQGDGGFVYIPPSEEETNWLIEHEPTVGAWIGGNKVARWEGAYAEYLAWLRTGTHCHMENGWSPGIGLFGYYSEGESFLSDYKWREKGWGPQVGIKYLATDWQWQAKFRFIWEDIDGHNDLSGYWMNQDDFKLGLYTEYVDFEHLREDGHYWGLTAEIWWMLKGNASISSSWSGDHPANRSSMYIGGFWQTELNDDWQLRLLGGLFHQEWDDLTGVRLAAEFRLWETIMFGPSVAFYPFGISDVYDGIATANNLTTLTGFVRLELQQPINNWFCSLERAKVKEQDQKWLEDVMEKLNTETKF